MKKILVVVLILLALAAGGLWLYFFEKEPLMSLKYPDEAEAVISEQNENEIKNENEAENLSHFQIETFDAKENATTAHQKHLNDALIFHSFPQNIEINKSTAVVASENCQFFEISSIKSDEDLKLLKNGTKIPIGTILTITGGAFRNSNAKESENGTFNFEKIKNYFYPVEYAGKNGIVFAGDLRGIDEAAEINEILSLRYTKNFNSAQNTQSVSTEKKETATSPNTQNTPSDTWQNIDALKNYQKFSQFFPFCGTIPLDSDLQKTLQKDKLAIKEISSIEYENILACSKNSILDPMLELYLSHYNLQTQKSETPLFFTSDLFAHFEDLLFKKVLLSVQEKAFLPKILLLCDEFIKTLTGESENIVDKAESITETGHDEITIIVPDEITQKALLYFQTARALGECINAENSNLLFNNFSQMTWQSATQISTAQIEKVEKSLETILENYPSEVQKEVLNILHAQGVESSPVFTFADGTSYKIDYSAFAIPAEYSQNASLMAFYRINKWFSSIKFPIAESNLLNSQKNFSDFTDEEKLAFKMSPVALYIANLAFNNLPLMENWQMLYFAQNALTGEGLNLSFEDISSVYSAKSEKSAKIWLSKTANIAEFALNASRKCLSPVLGNLPNDFKLYTAENVEGSKDAEKSQNSAENNAGKNAGEGNVQNLASSSGGSNNAGNLIAKNAKNGSSFQNIQNPAWALFSDNYKIEQWFNKSFASLSAQNKMPTKIDFLASLNSNFAKKNSDKQKIEIFTKCFNAQNDEFWNKNFQTLALKQTKALANFEPGVKLYFTESSAWGKKAMETASNFTLLFNFSNTQIENYKAENFDFIQNEKNATNATQSRTQDLPQMLHYIEANVDFFTGAKQSMAYLRAVLEAFNFDANQKELLNAVMLFENLMENAQKIAKIEMQNEPLTEEQVLWLEKIPFTLKEILTLYETDTKLEENKTPKIIKNIEISQNAQNIPPRLYIALNDNQGGKRIACGYILPTVE